MALCFTTLNLIGSKPVHRFYLLSLPFCFPTLGFCHRLQAHFKHFNFYCSVGSATYSATPSSRRNPCTMPPPGGKTPYAQWADPENIYPVHFNPLLVYDLEIEDFKVIEGNLSRDFGSFGEVKSIFLPKGNIVDGKMFAKIHYSDSDNAQKAMEGLAHKYKIADGKSAHKVMRKYREGLSKLDKSPHVVQPACATSFHDGHICRAPENSYEMIYKP